MDSVKKTENVKKKLNKSDLNWPSHPGRDRLIYLLKVYVVFVHLRNFYTYTSTSLS